MLSVVVGLFLAGLTYLQSQEIAKINWDKLQSASQGAISTLATTFGIPLTGSMATGFAIGFLKG